MKFRIIPSTVALAAILFIPFAASGAEARHCDEVASAVRAAILKEPPKVLVIVEDAMVANESCACEIVKTAIITTKADIELARQIVLTATHVAPKYSGVIADCANSVLSGNYGDVATSGGKGSMNVQPSEKGVVPVAPEPVYDPGYTAPYDIRGVYLIQPSTGLTTTTTTTTTTKIVTKTPPPRKSVPQSPSTVVQR